MRIPENINSLSLADAFTCYRDLGLRVYPVYPPDAKTTKNKPLVDAGKHPAVKEWWNYDPYDCDLRKYFGQNGSSFNIGTCPEPPILWVDLDSKPDKGASVLEWLAAHPELDNVPRHITRGGVHLMFLCDDLPRFLDEKGKPYFERLGAQLTDKVTAELFHSSHTNVVLPCSRHPVRDSESDPYFIYAWDSIDHEVPNITWKWLQEEFGFRAPEPKAKKRSRKQSAQWWLQFRGDLSSLNLLVLLEKLGHPSTLETGDTEKYGLLCPWHKEHSDGNDAPRGTSTVIWLPGGGNPLPGFKCLHAHCSGRGLKELLEWAESKSPGIVERNCTRERVWDESVQRHVGKKGLPQILHAVGRVESEVYAEIGKIIAPHHVWFNRMGELSYIELVPSGFEYSSDRTQRYKVISNTPGLRKLTAIKAKSILERYMEPGVLAQDENGEKTFVSKSFTTDFCAGMVESDHIKGELDHIARILTVPIPFRVGNDIVYPKTGFDPHFGTYLVEDAPQINHSMSLKDAWAWLATILSGFCFTNEQSRTHAIACLATPFSRAILGWTTRVPLWNYIGSRPRCGKDYLSGCKLIIYEGRASEDQPITGKDSAPETGKRILSAARAGRRFMHFSNCEQNLKDTSLIQAVTNDLLCGRNLGTNDGTADITVPNEMEFSVSFNLGLTVAPDWIPRSRQISLAFPDEDPNARKFADPHLHKTLATNRAKTLSAFAAIFNQWKKIGFPKGPTPFASFVDWAEIIGGVMFANREAMYAAFEPLPIDGVAQTREKSVPKGWGDPCLPWADDFSESVLDDRTVAMTALFRVCAHEFGHTYVKSTAITKCVAKYQVDGDKMPEGCPALSDAQLGALNDLGALNEGEDARKNKSKMMRVLRTFRGRILAGIQLRIKANSSKAERDEFMFTTLPTGDRGTDTVEPESATRENVEYDTEAQKPAQDTQPDEETAQNSEKTGGVGGDWGLFTLAAYAGEENRGNGHGACTHKNNSPGIGNRQNTPNVPNTPNLEIHAPVEFHLVNRPDLLPGALVSLHGDSPMAVDIETYGDRKPDALNARKGDIRLITAVTRGQQPHLFDVRAVAGNWAKPLLENRTAIGHNLAFDAEWLLEHLCVRLSPVFDTWSAARLLSNGDRTLKSDLKSVLDRFLNVQIEKEFGSSDWGAFFLSSEQYEYAATDVSYLHDLANALLADLKRNGLSRVFELEMQLLPVTIEMQVRGIPVNKSMLETALTEAQREVKEKETQLKDGLGQKFINLRSVPKVKEAFAAVGVDLESTDEETMAECEHPAAEMLIEHRGSEKERQQIESLLKAIGKDGRIHSQFKALKPETGRFSSTKPNIQNIPRGHLRHCFQPANKDLVFVVADYSQIELRIAAAIANDQVMLTAFRNREDLHKKTAAAVLSKSIDQVTKQDRQLAKAVAFGLLYGQMAEGLMQYAETTYGVIFELAESERLRTAFFSEYKAIARWHQKAWAEVDSATEVRTLLGRRRFLSEKLSRWNKFTYLVNTPVQGTGADILKMAMVELAPIIRPFDAFMVNTIHDELVIECPRINGDTVRDLCVTMMVKAADRILDHAVPIEVEAKVCENWGDK